MTYSDKEIRRRRQLGEDSGWEFKEVVFTGNKPRGPRRDTWADEIAAFANARGGVLLCGVTDDGDVQTISRAQMDALERLIVEVCSNSIQPPVRVDIFRQDAAEGQAILVVEVPEGHAQHDSPGGSFVRVGSAKRRMTSEERLRLAQRRGQARFLWFDKQPVDGTGFGTLDCTVNTGKGDSTGYIDRLLSQGHYYQIIATDDAHFRPTRPDWCSNWVMVRSPSPDPTALLAALHAGHFYSSQGPEFLEVTPLPGGTRLAVRTSPVRTIHLTGRGASNSTVAADSDFTTAELDLEAIKGPFARLTAIDHQGHRAWTNPIRL